MIITQEWWHQSKNGFQIVKKLQNHYNLVYKKSHIKQVENSQLPALETAQLLQLSQICTN